MSGASDQNRRLREARTAFEATVSDGLTFDERGALFLLILGRLEDRDNVPPDQRLVPQKDG